MSDRFKFRCWDKPRGVYEDAPNLLNQKGELISYHVRNDLSNFYDIEQCTGLKDKNGKLIYEGDIVELFAKNRYAKGIYQVKFDKNDCEYDLFDKDDDFLYQLKSDKSEYLTILGNIHENKELLDE